MYNGIGLTTPRGSGTSGHVMRNLSHLRPRDDYRSMQDRDMTVKHRAPDAAILEHDRKRKVEVQCLELQDELEDKGLAPEEVERQVDELRQRLTSQNRHSAGPTAERGSLKEFQTHELLAAKAIDNSRFERAFGISRDFVPGESLNKEKQEERRIERQLEKERRNEELAERKRQYEEGLEKRKAEQAVRDAAQREERAANMERNRAEVEARAKDREARMREIQSDREKGVGRSVPRARNDLVDSYRPGDRATRQRSRSPPPRRADTRGRDRSYSRSPSRSRSRSRSDSRGRSRSRSASRSRSPPRRRVSKGRRDSRSASRSRSPPPRRGRERSRSRSVASSSRSRARDASRSPPPRRRSPPARRSPSPVNAGRKTSPKRTREASASGSEDMDVQSD